MEALTELEDRLSVVPRWAIVRTIQKQTVDQHSFRVSLIAHRIAVDWFLVRDKAVLYDVLVYALRHDQDEAITGDVPATAKKYLNKKAVADIPMARVPAVSGLAKDIVKMADYIEALEFLRTERDLGNKSISAVWDDVGAQLRQFVREHAADWPIMVIGQCNQWFNGLDNPRVTEPHR